MSKDEYMVWDFSLPGITFSGKYGRITVFKKTMELIGFPEYYCFLFNQDADSLPFRLAGLMTMVRSESLTCGMETQ